MKSLNFGIQIYCILHILNWLYHFVIINQPHTWGRAGGRAGGRCWALAYLALLTHGACRQRLVQHLHIRVLRQVVEAAQVTDQPLQLLQELMGETRGATMRLVCVCVNHSLAEDIIKITLSRRAKYISTDAVKRSYFHHHSISLGGYVNI